MPTRPKKKVETKFSRLLIEAVKETEQLVRQSEVSSEQLLQRSEQNCLVLDSVIAEIGWPSISKVGEEAAYCAYFIALQTEDVIKQLAYLLLLSKAREDIDSTWLAYLTDRVCVRQARPQEFGTQFEDQGDKLALRKVKDWKQMEQNRVLAGLEQIEKYAQQMADSYGMEVVLTKTKIYKPKK